MLNKEIKITFGVILLISLALGAGVMLGRSDRMHRAENAYLRVRDRSIRKIPKPNTFITRRAEVLKVVDGDTVDLNIDLGAEVFLHSRIRVRGVDTPEMNSSDPKERERAKEATKFVMDAIYGKEVTVRLFFTGKQGKYHKGKYGRFVAEILYESPAGQLNLSEALLEAGFAKEYMVKP